MAEEISETILQRKKKRMHKASEMDINMTSMIDVLFMLMLFFLLGTRFGAHEGILLSKLPSLSVGGPTPPLDPVVVRVNEDGTHRPQVYVEFAREEGPQEAPVPFLTADEKKPLDERQMDDSRLYKRFKDDQAKTGPPGNRLVRLIPGSNVRWNYALQVYNTIWRAGYREVRWSRGGGE